MVSECPQAIAFNFWRTALRAFPAAWCDIKQDHSKISFSNCIGNQTDGSKVVPLPDISEEKGSLKELFKGKTAKEVVEEAREEDIKREF